MYLVNMLCLWVKFKYSEVNIGTGINNGTEKMNSAKFCKIIAIIRRNYLVEWCIDWMVTEVSFV